MRYVDSPKRLKSCDQFQIRSIRLMMKFSASLLFIFKKNYGN